MPNRIYRGPTHLEPITKNATIGSASLPGLIVKLSSGAFAVAADADDTDELFVLANKDFQGQDLATAYTSGDTAVAYEMRPNDVFQCRLAAATYAVGDELSVDANGRMHVASAGDFVMARFDGTAGAKSDDDLDDCKVANGYIKA